MLLIVLLGYYLSINKLTLVTLSISFLLSIIVGALSHIKKKNKNEADGFSLKPDIKRRYQGIPVINQNTNFRFLVDALFLGFPVVSLPADFRVYTQ